MEYQSGIFGIKGRLKTGVFVPLYSNEGTQKYFQKGSKNTSEPWIYQACK